MAFVGFWMIPLAFGYYAVEKILSVFGFDLTAWLGQPETQEGILEAIIDLTKFAEKAWPVAEPYVMPVIELWKDLMQLI